MPNTYRHAKIIFPGLLKHPLLDTFQDADRSYIVPEGPMNLVPIDGSMYDPVSGKWVFLFAVPPDSGIRLRRLHLWIEPDSAHPRGTKLLLYLYLEDPAFFTPITVYSGMFYILPFTFEFTEEEAGSEIINVHETDQQIYEGNYAEFSLKFLNRSGSPLTSQPIVYMLAEVR